MQMRKNVYCRIQINKLIIPLKAIIALLAIFLLDYLPFDRIISIYLILDICFIRRRVFVDCFRSLDIFRRINIFFIGWIVFSRTQKPASEGMILSCGVSSRSTKVTFTKSWNSNNNMILPDQLSIASNT